MPRFSGLDPCCPKTTEPFSSVRMVARRLANSSCFSSLKRWKKEEAWIADIRCWRGVSDVSELKAGVGLVGLLQSVVQLKGERDNTAGSKMSPAMNAAGNEAGVDLNNSCPQSQKPCRRSEARTLLTGQPSITAFLMSVPTGKNNNILVIKKKKKISKEYNSTDNNSQYQVRWDLYVLEGA